MIEIGPGTGQATRSLAGAGASVIAVELGAQLASVLRENVCGTDRPGGAQRVRGLVTAVAGRPRDVLHGLALGRQDHPGGSGARRPRARRPAGDRDDRSCPWRHGRVLRAGQECYLRWDPATDPDELLQSPAELPEITDEIDTDPRFAPAVRRRYVRDISYTADDYLAVLQTYSGHRALIPERRSGLLSCLRALIEDQYDGMITKTYLHELRVAQAYHR